MTPSSPLRVLTNASLPAVDGYVQRTFGDYRATEAGTLPAWRPEKERRALADILPLIPASEKPDILIISTPEYLPIPVDVAAFPGIRILLITDWNVCLRFLPDLCPLFDFCFTDWPGFRLLAKAGIANVRHQPLFGHDPSAFIHQGMPRNLDVSFCGNLNAGLHRERNRLLARLAKWAAAGARPVHLGQAFNRDYVDVLNRSRLVFNYSIRGEANMRLFEAMACGAVPLIEASNREVPILFQPGRHYFRYEPDRLEETLEALLADPARIEAVSLEARIAVSGHTKAAQIRSVLEAAVREHAAGSAPAVTPALSAASLAAAPLESMKTRAPPKTLSSATSPDSLKALVKLRVLGAAYTLPEALEELQARSAALPGLDAETLPGALLSLLEANPGGGLNAARNILLHLLDAGGRPASVNAFFRMRLHALDGRWEAVLEASRLCREESEPEGRGASLEAYRHFLAPVELGKGLNTDLNRAFRADLESKGKTATAEKSGVAPQSPLESHPGYPALMRAHCLALETRALLALGRPREAMLRAEALPAGGFVSVDAFGPLADACAAAGDTARLRAVLRNGYREMPLDTAVWTRVAEGLDRLGDKAELIAFLEEILVLSRYFLPPAHMEMVRALLAKYQ